MLKITGAVTKRVEDKRMLLMIIAIALTFVAYYLTESLVYSIVFLVAMVLLNRTLQPYVTRLGNKIFPKPYIYPFRSINMEGDEALGRGVRITVMTQDCEFDAESGKNAALYDELVDKAAALMREKSEVFSFRYDRVFERDLPREYTWCLCGEKDSGARKCYKQWLLHIQTKYFGNWVENSELFLADVQFQKPEHDTVYAAAVLFMFDSRMPKAAPKPAPEAETEKTPEAEHVAEPAAETPPEAEPAADMEAN